jgi:hypothetical protein
MQLTDVGITYDYTGPRSPEEVAERSEVVLAGRLTGASEARRAPPEYPVSPSGTDPLSSVGYEVVIDAVYKAPVELNPNELVWVDHNPTYEADPFVGAIAPDAPVAS